MSAATVSRVLNDSPLVMDETRARVQAAVDELGYRLNATARTLSIGRAQAVGVVVPFFTTHSVIERLRGVVARLGAPRTAQAMTCCCSTSRRPSSARTRCATSRAATASPAC